MSNQRLFLLHSDRVFLDRFSSYLEKKAKIGLRCSCFTDEKEMLGQLEEITPSLMIVREGCPLEAAKERGIPVLVFSEGTEEEGEGRFPLYRAMDKQIRQIRRYLKQDGSQSRDPLPCRILGFYSPVHGAGQSVSAILTGLFLGEQGPALLLNLERYSGLKEMLPFENGGLSDLLYFARIQADPLEHLPELTEYYGSLALIPPARNPEDLLEMSREDWRFLLGRIRESGLYRFILLDIGDGIRKTEDLLDLCDRIYVPLREDRLALTKLEEWREDLGDKKGEAFLSRLRPYRLPPEELPEWVEYRQLRMMSWGKNLRALAEAEL
ncbi:MAG: hypothetical protein J6H18_05670 [Lachnospiraceae bacterium]|nr:hypothetical protein [Lachnospiraceae bacterium]